MYTMSCILENLSFSLLVLFCLTLTVGTQTTVLEELTDENCTCTTCYKALVTELLKDERNYYTMQTTFFPPISTNPVFVTVTYQFENETAIFFWSSAVYFFFHPVRIFQFTSLLFSDPSLRYNEMTLYLPENCNGDLGNDTFNDYMLLLTQRLKLYTMHQTTTAPIDATYTAYSHSVNTLNNWYVTNLTVGEIALISQVLFPVFVTFYIVIFFMFAIEHEPHNLGKKLENALNSGTSRINAEARSNLLTKVIISILFHVCTLAADIAALCHYNLLPDNVHKYYFSSPKLFWSVPIAMTSFDTVAFVLFVFIPFILSRKKRYKLIYCLIAPLSCIVSHSYHIIFAFIHDPYHATSILLLYAIVIFVHVVGFQKIFYFINSLKLWKKSIKCCDCSDKCLDCSSVCECCRNCYECLKQNTVLRCIVKSIGWLICNIIIILKFVYKLVIGSCQWIFLKIGLYNTTLIIYIIEFLFVAGSIGLTLAFLVLLPFSNAIDDAPSRLYVIYQASVTFFAALIAFQVIFRQTNSVFTVFIKAINDDKLLQSTRDDIKLKDICQVDNSKTWEDMSEKEKESFLAKWAMSALIPKIPLAAEAQTRDTAPATRGSDPQNPHTERVDPHSSPETQVQPHDDRINDERELQTPNRPLAPEAAPTAPDETPLQPSLIPHHDLIISRARPGQHNNSDAPTVLCSCGNNNNYEQVGTPD